MNNPSPEDPFEPDIAAVCATHRSTGNFWPSPSCLRMIRLNSWRLLRNGQRSELKICSVHHQQSIHISVDMLLEVWTGRNREEIILTVSTARLYQILSVFLWNAIFWMSYNKDYFCWFVVLVTLINVDCSAYSKIKYHEANGVITITLSWRRFKYWSHNLMSTFLWYSSFAIQHNNLAGTDPLLLSEPEL